MSYYDNENTWATQGRQPSWEPSRSGANSAMSQQHQQQQQQAHIAEPNAFAAQFEEIERATDNLMRSGKWFPGTPGAAAAGRRDSTPNARGFDYAGDTRNARHHASGSEFDNRPGSSGLQGFYQGQRFPSRQSEAEQVLHAKRRMAAQRERELRNYHQEQQYNRNSSTAKPDRSMSPNTMSEEDRRDLIARQHRALYGDNSNLYTPDGAPQRPKGQDARVPSGGRGSSPLAFEQYGNNQPQAGADGVVQMPPRIENTASPAVSQQLNESQQSRTSTTSPPHASPPVQGNQKAGAVGPIGRPGNNAGANKRATTPLTPSSLNYYSNESQTASNQDERSSSATPNPPLSGDKPMNLGGGAWGNNSGVWGKNAMNSQTSVWG